MEIQSIHYDPTTVVETSQGNKVSKAAHICGSQNIMLAGNSILFEDVTVRGDLGAIRIGKHSVVRERAIIRPPVKRFTPTPAFMQITIGDCVMIEQDCIVSAAVIGSYVHIGKGCVIGNRVIIKECAVVLDGAVIPEDQTVPSFAVVAGNPAQIVKTAPESTQILMKDAMKQFYHAYSRESADHS
uniref:Dynactin subunit 5 n=1 Tax=Panagrellus redivivus TaxID=6233 RepID=A0A7E4UZ04_PANRE